MALKIVDLRAQMPNYNNYKDWKRPGAIEGIAVHHTGYGSADPASGAPSTTPQQVFDYHVKTLGWAHGGYNYIIGADGTVFSVLDEAIPPFHCGLNEPDKNKEPDKWRQWVELERGQYFNNHYVAICLLGWFSRNRILYRDGTQIRIPDTNTTPTQPQWAALLELLRELQARYRVALSRVQGHRELRASVGFGATECPGTEISLDGMRRALEAGETPGPSPQPAPAVTRNRPLVGLHARNDAVFTPVDYEIVRQARVESMKTLSFLSDEVYAALRGMNPQMEFIVRLYTHMPRGSVVPPQQFADEFQPLIERFGKKFSILKYEIHNEPNHLTGLEGWGQTEQDARDFQAWYKQVFAILKQRNPWALFGFPGLAVPHNDLQWLDWAREAIEISDWLGCHIYWQTPANAPNTYRDDVWGGRYQTYHARYPHKLIEVTEYGNSNGQSGIPLSEQEQAAQYVWWLTNIQRFSYLGSAHAFIATSPDPTWVNQRFTWGDPSSGRVFQVASAVGQNVPRPPVPPNWQAVFRGFTVSGGVPPQSRITLAGTLVNAGRLPWRNDGYSRSTLVAWWTDGAGARVGEMQYFALPTDMAPSEETGLTLQVNTPAQPGDDTLVLDLYQKGFERWISALGPGKPFVQGVRVGEVVPPLRAQWLSQSVPATIRAGDRVSASFVVRNAGSRPWRQGPPEKGQVHLGYHWIGANSQEIEGPTRGPLPTDVAPGQQVQIDNVILQAPPEPGRYQLRVDMVSELEAWFRQVGGQPLVLNVTVEPSGPPLAFEWLAVEIPREMRAGEPVSGRVTVKNTGTETWLASKPDGAGITRFGYHWRTADGQPVEGTWRDIRTPLPNDVKPGEGVVIQDAEIAPPSVAGPYRLDLGLVKEGVTWFPDPTSNPGSFPVQVAPPRPAYAVEYLQHTVPAQLLPGQSTRVSFQLRNHGSQTWRAGGPMPVTLANNWLEDGAEANVLDEFRALLPNDVPPDGVVTLTGVIIRAPGSPGRYTLRWELVEEQVTWFSDQGVQPLDLAVEVVATVPTRPEWDVAWLEHRVPTELVVSPSARASLRFKNSGSRPWKAGSPNPVRVGYHWYDGAGNLVSALGDLRTALPKDIAPDEEVAFAAAFATPDRPGGYTLEWDLVEEGVSWFKDRGVSPLRAAISIQAQPPATNGWIATASHNPAEVERAIDRDPHTSWSSRVAQQPDMFFQVDIGQLKPIDMVTVASPGHGFAAGYRVRVSPDGANWITVAERASNNEDIRALFNPINVRYVRIEQTGTVSDNTRWLISEISLHENPLWVADASHNNADVARAFDNREDTVWTTGAPQTADMWFLLDMGQQEEVKGFILNNGPHEEYPRGFLLQISPDGKKWETMYQVPSNWNKIHLDFDNVFVGRYISIRQINQTPWYPWTISELFVKRNR
ncbi:MAG: discoidin domain-containing protein [Ardenticatenaceae bacterium]|nr:discoidin domain-containing protein [Ardenticatenaceae bacterium]